MFGEHVLVTVPCEHWLRAEVAERLMRIMTDGRYRVTFEFPCHRPYENNQHHVVSHLLLPNDYQWWVSIDSDNPPRRNPLDLIELDRDVVGCPTPIWHWERRGDRPICWNVFDWDADAGAYVEHKGEEGLQRVDGIGTGCFVASRRVFEHPALQSGPFTRTLELDGTVRLGNDMAFSQRAREAGFQLWAHFDYPCDHFQEINLLDVVAAYQQVTHG